MHGNPENAWESRKCTGIPKIDRRRERNIPAQDFEKNKKKILGRNLVWRQSVGFEGENINIKLIVQ